MHQQQADADRRQADAEQDPDRDPVRERAGDRRGDEGEHGQRQEAQAGLQRRVAEHALHVDRQVEEHREHPRREAEGDRRDAVEGGLAEQAQVEHRVVAARARSRRRRPAATAAPIRQATISGLPQPSGLPRIRPKISRKRASEKVTRPGTSIRLGVLGGDVDELALGQRDRHEPDRDVDEEDPLPAEVLGDHAADQRADRDRAADRRPPDAERGRPVLAVELLADQRQRGGEHRRRRRPPAGRGRG